MQSGETEPIYKHFFLTFLYCTHLSQFVPVFLYVCFCCKVWHFDMDFYQDWLAFKASLKVPIEELKFFLLLDGFTYKPQRLPLGNGIYTYRGNLSRYYLLCPSWINIHQSAWKSQKKEASKLAMIIDFFSVSNPVLVVNTSMSTS